MALLLQAFRPIDTCAETPVLPSLAEEAVAALRQTGHWEWAIFVAIFDVSSFRRRWRVREILARHIDGVSAMRGFGGGRSVEGTAGCVFGG